MEIDHRPTLPVLPTLLVLNATTSSLIALRLRWPIRLAAFVSYTCILGLAYQCTTRNMHRDYVMGCSLANQFLHAFHLLWLTDPLMELHHERDHVHPSQLSFIRRIYWALCTLYSYRGVGWNYQVANVPERIKTPKWRFALQKLSSALRCYVFIDAIQLYILHTNPQDRLQHCLYGLARFSTMYAFLALYYALFATVSVTIGLSEPQDWPAVFGKWSDAYTIRRFWGRTYHQMIRRYTTSTGKWACRLLGLKPGTWASSYTQLYVGFAVSGLMHCGGDLMVRPSIYGASLTYFIAQAVAISVEDAIIDVAKRTRLRCPELLTRCLGYAWVFLWLGISTPWLFNWTIQAGVSDKQRLPFSLIEMGFWGLVTGSIKFASVVHSL
ncbi:hypothetical protein WOLCODRAFT_140944 [Wolfiporia cocos MD-104 SS10]|uniref:Wax synthase domain-containing protein n=1 Tax=Wolfiporia cocos (strain MD-104) TaxID=742152 RepID=A0A2H3J6M6_WOLCO|nr:hypothetical protein WOLCODRAFT_140944 [Wolfiporia cocos MD-104 SS10]